jgi:aromatic ring-opening dioxygenase catalytic subunit (LigB family)
MGQIIAAGATVHAPQFFTYPPTEDFQQLDASIAAMRQLGRQMLDGDRPDAVIVIGSDHLETFFLSAVPTFALIGGERVKAAFAGRAYDLPCHGMSEALIDHLVGAGFDMVYSQDAVLGHAFAAPFEWVMEKRDIPVVAMFVNSYLPPLPTARRCAALGAAVAQFLSARPERVAIIASGGLSHYPGTWKYPEPAYDFDRWAIGQMERGNLEALLSLTNRQIDEVGNTEMLSWAVMFGALLEQARLEQTPQEKRGAPAGELLTYQPTWHHGHAVMRFLPPRETPADATPLPPYRFANEPHEFYAHPSPSSYNLNKLLYDLRHDPALRRQMIEHPAEVAAARQLSPREAAVIDTMLDEDIDLLRNRKTHPVVEAGAHPLGLLMSLITVQAEIRRMRKEAKEAQV